MHSNHLDPHFFEASYGATLDDSPVALVGQSAGAQLAATPGNPRGEAWPG